MNERDILLQYMNGLGKDKTRRPLFLIVHEDLRVADELAARLSEVMEKEYVRKKTTNAGDGHGYYDWVDPDDVFSTDDVSRHVVGTNNVDSTDLYHVITDNQLVRATFMGVTPHEMNNILDSGFDESHFDDIELIPIYLREGDVIQNMHPYLEVGVNYIEIDMKFGTGFIVKQLCSLHRVLEVISGMSRAYWDYDETALLADEMIYFAKNGDKFFGDVDSFDYRLEHCLSKYNKLNAQAIMSPNELTKSTMNHIVLVASNKEALISQLTVDMLSLTQYGLELLKLGDITEAVFEQRLNRLYSAITTPIDMELERFDERLHTLMSKYRDTLLDEPTTPTIELKKELDYVVKLNTIDSEGNKPKGVVELQLYVPEDVERHISDDDMGLLVSALHANIRSFMDDPQAYRKLLEQ
jgi:hypothetical protein